MDSPPELTQSNPAPRIRMDLAFLTNVPETMPLYEYECEKCGHRFEKIQKFSDKMVKKCPECGGRVEQMISAPAVQFKGSGWYATDYGGKSSDGSSKKPESSTETAKTQPSTDTAKPEPAKESTAKKKKDKE